MSERSLREQVSAVEDRLSINDVLCRYAFSIDRRQWDEFASCFADEVDVNLIRTNGWVRLRSFDLVQTVQKVFETYTATQHLSANHHVSIEGDSAEAWSTLNATHYLKESVGDQFHQQVGYYEYHLPRGREWRISKMQQFVHWQRGNQQIFDNTLNR